VIRFIRAWQFYKVGRVITLPDLTRQWPGYHPARLRDWLLQSGFCVADEPVLSSAAPTTPEVAPVRVTESESPSKPKKKKKKAVVAE
jgi:hypothetical protein